LTREPELCNPALNTKVSVREAARHSFSIPQQHSEAAPSPVKTSVSVPMFEIVSHSKQREQRINAIRPEEPVRFGSDDYRLIGAVFSGYWIVEQNDTMFLIDQHAAHERRLYEDLMARRIEPSTQSLLIPERMKLTAEEFSIYEEYREAIEQFGFIIQPIMDAPFELDVIAVPMIAGASLAPNQIRDALEILSQSGAIHDKDLCRRSLIQTACKHAIKVNDPISRAEIQHLLAEYAKGTIPMTCPHGRPIMVQLTKLDIEKMFKRVL